MLFISFSTSFSSPYFEPWEKKNPCFIVAGCRDMTAGWDIPRQRLTTAAVNWPPWASRRLVIHVLKDSHPLDTILWVCCCYTEGKKKKKIEETRSLPPGPAEIAVVPPTMTDEWGNEPRCWREVEWRAAPKTCDVYDPALFFSRSHRLYRLDKLRQQQYYVHGETKQKKKLRRWFRPPRKDIVCLSVHMMMRRWMTVGRDHIRMIGISSTACFFIFFL